MKNFGRFRLKSSLKRYIGRQIDAKIEIALMEFLISGQSELTSQSKANLFRIPSQMEIAIGALSDIANLLSGRKTIPIKNISIIIPTKNRFNYLAKALNSCNWQTRTPNEIVIVNDGDVFTEAENTEIKEIIAGKCSLIIIQNKYRGAAGARKTGIEISSAEILTYLDDDNLMWPTWLETVDREFSLDSDQLIYGAQLRKGWKDNMLAQTDYSHQRLCESSYIDTSSIAHHKNFGQWDIELDIVEDDWDFVLSIASRENSSIRYVPELSSIYFTDAVNRISTTKKQGGNVLSKKYRAFFEQHLS